MARARAYRTEGTSNDTIVYYKAGGGSTFLLWLIAILFLIFAYSTLFDLNESSRLLLKVG